MDSGPNRRNKAVFSNSLGVVWTWLWWGPQGAEKTNFRCH